MPRRRLASALAARQRTIAAPSRLLMAGLIKGLTVFATLGSFSGMRLRFVFAALICFAAIETSSAQEKRNWFSRVLHPFGSSQKVPDYRDPKIRGLLLT